MAEVLALLSIQRWIFQAVAMSLTAAVIPGLKITSVFGPILAVVSLAFLNSHIWSAALFFQIPDTISSQAAVLILVNGGIFWLLVKLLPGIEVKGILPAIAAPVVFTILSVVVERYGMEIDWNGVFVEGLKMVSSVKEYFLTQPPS
ncbi:MAG: phage holin family protein [Bdellovibrionales bacterium]|nr:phage holin family protein [Bdellovibrionales bacterium]